jgi:hypothetical protein
MRRSTARAREVDSDHAEVADAILGAESATGEFTDHPDFALGQSEDLGGLVADASGKLSGGVESQAVLAPVGDDAVRLHWDMSLDLGAVLAFDDDVSLRQTLLDISSRSAKSLTGIGATHVAPLRQSWRRADPARRRGLLGRARKDRWRTILHRFLRASPAIGMAPDGSVPCGSPRP